METSAVTDRPPNQSTRMHCHATVCQPIPDSREARLASKVHHGSSAQSASRSAPGPPVRAMPCSRRPPLPSPRARAPCGTSWRQWPRRQLGGLRRTGARRRRRAGWPNVDRAARIPRIVSPCAAIGDPVAISYAAGDAAVASATTRDGDRRPSEKSERGVQNPARHYATHRISEGIISARPSAAPAGSTINATRPSWIALPGGTTTRAPACSACFVATFTSSTFR